MFVYRDISDNNDTLVEKANEGIDFVRINKDVTEYTLLDNFERLVSNHQADIDTQLTGNDANNILYSSRSNDSMDGGAGRDAVHYFYAKNGIHVDLNTIEAQDTGDGLDTLIHIENIYGSKYNDTLTGDAKNNYINGLDGDDVISAGAGNDRLLGGNGSDTLIGGAGRDVLTGGMGNDTFVLESISDSNRNLKFSDVVKDFVSGQDLIDLSAMDANSDKTGKQDFTVMLEANQLFTEAGQLQFKDGVLYGNTNSDS